MPSALSADGTTLSYRLHGPSAPAGPPVVFCNGLATLDFYWEPLLSRLAPQARCLTWDLKGHGGSAPAATAGSATVPAMVDDLLAILDHAGLERAVLVGFSLGCQVVLEAWRRAPHRIAGLVTAFGNYGRPFDTLLHPSVGPQAYAVVRRFGPRRFGALLRSGYLLSRTPLFHRMNQLTWMVGQDVSRAQMQPFYDHMGRIDLQTFAWMVQSVGDHTTESVLPTVQVPTLVLAGGRDLMTPVHRGRVIAEQVPGARLVELPRATHTGLLDEADAVNDAVEAFLNDNGLLG